MTARAEAALTCPSTFFWNPCDQPLGHRGLHSATTHHANSDHSVTWEDAAADPKDKT